VTCVCATIGRVDNRIGLTILQHPRERLHPLGTTRIARLGFTNVRVISCSQWEDGVDPIAVPDGTALLYPSRHGRTLDALLPGEHPRHLVVLDGTWFQAKKIYDAQRWLHTLPHVHITPAAPSGYGNTRAEPKAGYVATIEAIIYALRLLEPATAGLDGLLRSFTMMVERQAAFTP
jgi:DTW domain-containing protein